MSILRDAGLPLRLMLDEPTTGMVESDAIHLLTLVQRLAANRAILVVLHHPGHARFVADRVILTPAVAFRVYGHRDLLQCPQE